MTYIVNNNGEVWGDWPHHPESASCSCGWINEVTT